MDNIQKKFDDTKAPRNEVDDPAIIKCDGSNFDIYRREWQHMVRCPLPRFCGGFGIDNVYYRLPIILVAGLLAIPVDRFFAAISNIKGIK